MSIETPEELREHIELAIRVELSTIPPYLFAMYSIEDQKSEAALLIRSIVAEEMLHAALATNLLIAVGGTPRFEGRAYFPDYPMDLPHHRPPLRLELSRCTQATIREVFMRIEQPEIHEAPAQEDEFETLGQFYHALENGLRAVDEQVGLFSNHRVERQMASHSYYRPVTFDVEDSGGLMAITDLESAIDAIEIIVHQGEGLGDHRWADPDHRELTHYHKLVQILEGVSPLGEVIPLRSNPRTGHYPQELVPVSDLFNALYRSVYLALTAIFNDDSDQDQAVGVLYLLMGDMMSRTAHFLVQQELEDGTYAAPTFEYYEFGSDDPLEEVAGLADVVAEIHPDMTSVRDGMKGLNLIL